MVFSVPSLPRHLREISVDLVMKAQGLLGAEPANSLRGRAVRSFGSAARLAALVLAASSCGSAALADGQPAAGGELLAVSPGSDDVRADTADDTAGPGAPLEPPAPWQAAAPGCAADSEPPLVVPLEGGACDYDLGAPPEDELVVIKEWEVTDGGGVDSPIPVANLTDDNGDGVIDAADVPDLVVVQKQKLVDPAPGASWEFQANTTLRVYSGDGTGIHWEWPPPGTPLASRPNSFAMPAIGDLDSDGLPEVVVLTGFAAPQHRLVALDHMGTVRWEGPQGIPAFPLPVQPSYQASPSLVDLDHDGCAEVLSASWVFDCHGTLIAEIDVPARAPAPWDPDSDPAVVASWPGVAVDLDLDGSAELVFAHGTYDRFGVRLWGTDYLLGIAAAADLDGDGWTEIVASGAHQVAQGYGHGACRVFGSSGQVSADIAAPCGWFPPLIEDLDHDGWAEFVLPGPYSLTAYRADGTHLWILGADDPAGTTAVAADLDGDGRIEVIHAGPFSIKILDGPTGATRWVDDTHLSATIWEHPVVADIDGDGRAEFVITRGANGDGGTALAGFTVFGSGDAVEGAWAPARPIWNQADYHQTNVEDDGSIPLYEVPHFTANNSVRSAAEPPLDPDAAWKPIIGRDVSIELAAACASDCDSGVLQITVWALNSGFGLLPAGIPVSVRRQSGGLLQVLETDAWISTFKASAPLTFSFKASDAGGEGLVVTVDDDAAGVGIVDECDETNNALTLPPPVCIP